MSEEPTYDELESLFVNNEKLDRIAAYLNRFNPIRVMKMADMEIRHSAILAWLLDPVETHGLGDRFLKAFLGEALRGQSGLGSPTALEVAQSDLRDTEIRREWQSIDLFILVPSNGWAFVIENKFHSHQHEGQLVKYIEKVKSTFEPQEGEITVRGIFLTLHDEEPRDASYAVLRYSAICDFLPRLVEQEGQSLGEEVRVFLNHYLEVIKDAAGMSEKRTEMEELARQLYRSHKKALDFVIEHGARTEFTIAVESLFGEQTEYGDIVQIGRNRYMYSAHGTRDVSFVPESWYSSLGKDEYYWPGCNDWWAGYPLICWLTLVDGDDGIKGILRLNAEIGPISNYDFRKGLIDKIKVMAEENGLDKIRFQVGATEEGRKYSRFFRSNTIAVNDVSDAEVIAKAIADLLNRFQPSFDAVAKVLPDFVTYGTAEQ